MGRLSLGSWLYFAAIVAVASVIIAIAPTGTADKTWWACYAVLALLFLICDSTPTPLAARQSAWSPSSAATLAAVVLLHGGFGAAMVGASAVLTLRRQVPLYERLFNGAMYAVAGYAAGVAYLAAGDKPHPFTPHLIQRRPGGVSLRLRCLCWSPTTSDSLALAW